MEIEEETKEKGTMENVIKQTNKLLNIIQKVMIRLFLLIYVSLYN
jgi:hypothetical protein